MLGSISRYSRLRTIAFAALTAAAFLGSQAPASVAAADPVATADPVAVAGPVVTADPVATTPAVTEPQPVAPPLVATPTPAPVVASVHARATESAATAVVRAAESHLGARYRRGAMGPSAFDCSGLVYRAFAQVGLGSKIGGLHSAYALYAYFSRHHLASRSAPKVGDLVIWGHGSHVGIYVGNGRAISALTSGVRITRVSAVLSGFTTYLHTRLATARVATGRVVTARVAAIHRVSTTASHVRRVTSVAYLRSAPGTSHGRIATLHRGVRLTVIGSRHLPDHQLWLHVRTAAGRTGWVASWLVRP